MEEGHQHLHVMAGTALTRRPTRGYIPLRGLRPRRRGTTRPGSRRPAHWAVARIIADRRHSHTARNPTPDGQRHDRRPVWRCRRIRRRRRRPGGSAPRVRAVPAALLRASRGLAHSRPVHPDPPRCTRHRHAVPLPADAPRLTLTSPKRSGTEVEGILGVEERDTRRFRGGRRLGGPEPATWMDLSRTEPRRRRSRPVA